MSLLFYFFQQMLLTNWIKGAGHHLAKEYCGQEGQGDLSLVNTIKFNLSSWLSGAYFSN
jgi:hypothetical protein